MPLLEPALRRPTGRRRAPVRRVPRAVLVLVATAALVTGALVGGTGSAPARAAAPTLSVTRVVSGNRTVTAAWKAVPHASGYVLRVSAKKTMKAPKSVRTTQLHAAVHGLKNGRTAYVRVDAVLPRATLRGAVTKAHPSAAQPLPVAGVTAVRAGADQISVHWTGGGTATHVAVLAGGDAFLSTFRFGTTWHAATTRRLVLTVPKAFRDTLGARSGQPVFVRVLESNSLAAHAVKGTYTDPTALLQVSPYGTWSLAGADQISTKGFSTVTVGEMNVQSVGASAGFTKTDQWLQRAPRVVNTIEAADPALLTTAEASTSLVCFLG